VRDEDRQGAEPSDLELVERGRSGDDAALSTLARRHHEAAYRVAVGFVRDDDVAQDVVQDAFVKAFMALGGFRADAAFRTWLLTITANEAKGALRRQGRRKETALEDAEEVRSEEGGPAHDTMVRDEAGRARKMLEQLPEKQRLSVTLRIDEGLSFKEIGDVIGSSEGAARVNYFHGIRRLKELMER